MKFIFDIIAHCVFYAFFWIVLIISFEVTGLLAPKAIQKISIGNLMVLQVLLSLFFIFYKFYI